jgi:hypothetical protein
LKRFLPGPFCWLHLRKYVLNTSRSVITNRCFHVVEKQRRRLARRQLVHVMLRHRVFAHRQHHVLEQLLDQMNLHKHQRRNYATLLVQHSIFKAKIYD